MKKALNNVLIFTTGAAFGSLVTWKFLKTKYERIVQEEIESVKETWAQKNRKETDVSEYDDSTDDLDDEEWVEGAMVDYSALTRKYNRALQEEIEEEGGGDEDGFPYINGPVVIKPEDYGDGNFDHDLYCITYYADGVLADDWWVKLDIEETIGEDAIEHFGDFAEDVVHVRNERLKADYEVTRDPRNYADVVANNLLAPTYED